ncbi:class I SAM-dependent methyltransferase [Streptomyces sp. YC504]|uniref:Class I SAM-dependent methyltransferase n=1 Tax=Streptomyces mesophilus TaxID=1775132 RepID=A0A6G4XTN2_9ACTN|nr:methyltransferase domain-containing protein [Streptomyces mesophilus]NGO80925.1 class I SAM-dependent methyltransferase [Streptomyces mesophilus]
MHPAALDHMRICVEQYMPADRRLTVVDVGSQIAAQSLNHRMVLEDRDIDYIGIDIEAGENVDRVMPRPYTFPVKSRSADFVISGQALEHIPFPWVTMMEIARVLKPGGRAFITVPSRGHEHYGQDCWRYYPDSFRALAAYAKLRMVEAHTDFPPRLEGSRRYDYARIDYRRNYWGDSVGVFRKPKGYPEKRMTLVRAFSRLYANHVGGLQDVPRPKANPARGRRPVTGRPGAKV